MPIELPDGTQPASIIDPDNRTIVEVRDPNGVVVWTSDEPAPSPVIEDFEDYTSSENMRTAYDAPPNHMGFMHLEETVALEGQQSGRFDAQNIRPTKVTGQTDTPLDHRYEFLVQGNVSTVHPGMMFETLDASSPLDDSYHIHVSWRDDHVNLRSWVNGSLVDNPNFAITPLTVGDTYRVRVDYTHDTTANEAVFDIEVFDSTDTSMGSGELRATDAHVGLGSWGWISGRDTDATNPTYVDYLTHDDIPVEGITAITWETQTDWQAAQTRERILSQAYPTLNADTLRQGYDINDEPFVWYWSLNESTPPLSNENSTTADWEMQSSYNDTQLYDFDAPGLHSTTGVSSARSGHLVVNELPVADLKSDWAIGCWVYWFNLTHSLQSAFGFDDLTPDRSESISFGADDANIKIYSVGKTPGNGQVLSTNTWYHVVLRHDVTAENLEIFVDGVSDYSVNYSGGTTWIDELTGMSLLNRHPGSDTEHDGRVADPFFYDGYPTTTQISRWYDTGASGFLHTAKVQREGAATELEAEAVIRADSSIDVTVVQETGNGDNTQLVALSDGTDTYNLTGFDNITSDYYLQIEHANTDVEVTSELISATLR